MAADVVPLAAAMIDRLWWWALMVITMLIIAAMVHAQPRTYSLAIGRFGGTDQEIQECQFSIGTGAMLLLHPRGDMCVVARELIGRTGTLMFVADGVDSP